MSDKYTPYGMEQRYTRVAHEYFDEVLVAEKHLSETQEDLIIRKKELEKYGHTTFEKELERRDRAIKSVSDLINESKKKIEDRRNLVINQRFAVLLAVLIALGSFLLGRCSQ